MSSVPCIGCGGLFPESEGPTHRYMESSPGCWKAYGEVLVREYRDYAFFSPVHRLSVDAYAVQHPGRPSPQSIQSVAVHLIRLCLILERGLPMQLANDAMLAAAKTKARFVWLPPPPTRGAVTAADVFRAKDDTEHLELVRAWADSAWSAWAPHHDTVRSWLPAAFGGKGNRFSRMHSLPA